jgi:protein arginine N-methyltransferase 1
MAVSLLQRLSQRGFGRLGRWLDAHPRAAAWVRGAEPADFESRYRDFNGRYFADFHEHERMLSDQPRMAFYRAAIARHVRAGDHVVDLGTGTGILAALAARQGAARVDALDHSPILEHARALAQANQLPQITFHGTHSREFRPAERVDVLLHEQMGDCLFDEAMVENVVELRDRVLKPGGRILPARFEFFCEPVQVHDHRVVPFIWDLKVPGYDYSSLERARPQEPGYYRLCSSDVGLVSHFLSEPSPALAFDLHTVTAGGLGRDLRHTRSVVRGGRLDGYAVFFRARVDDDLVLDTGPLNPGRAPHWGFRILRTESLRLEPGDRLDIRLSAERWADLDSWRWSHTHVPAADMLRTASAPKA